VCQRKLPKLDYSSDEWKSAVEAAAKAYYGDDNIPALKNALFYHAVYVKPGWKKYKKLKKIGDHVFYGLV
jgi:spore germination cell wall hydrolase CwlJ-like protein